MLAFTPIHAFWECVMVQRAPLRAAKPFITLFFLLTLPIADSNSQTAPNPGGPKSPASIAALNQLSRSPNNEIRRRAQQLQNSFCSQPVAQLLIELLHRDFDYKPATDICEGFLAECTKDKNIGYF